MIGLLLSLSISVWAGLQASPSGPWCGLDVKRAAAVSCGWKQAAGETAFERRLSFSVARVPQRWQGLVREQFSWWERRVPGVRFEEAFVCEDRCLSVSWVPLQSGIYGYGYYPCYQEPVAGDIQVNVLVDWGRLGNNVLTWLIRHEIGHALGLGHSTEQGYLMYPYQARAGMELRVAEQIALSRLYRVRIRPASPVSGGRP